MKNLTLTLTALLFTLNVAWASSPEDTAVPDAVPKKLPHGYIANDGLIWAPLSDTVATLSEAKKTCASSTALGYKWRQPTKDELIALTRYNGSRPGIRHEFTIRDESEPLASQGWTLHDVWSSTPGTIWGVQYIVNLESSLVNYGDENGASHVSCVSSTD